MFKNRSCLDTGLICSSDLLSSLHWFYLPVSPHLIPNSFCAQGMLLSICPELIINVNFLFFGWINSNV
jgi:hypothetical protein